MFKLKRRSGKGKVLLQAGRETPRHLGGRRALRIAAGIGVGAGTVLFAFVMTWIITF